MSEKMNVLFIITDQQRADHLGCVGNPILKTPNLDKFASESVLFNSAYCANPICMPNRASIFTGLYPNMHGIRTAGMNLPTNVPTFTETLRNSGYQTAAIGKIHLQFYSAALKKGARSAESIVAWTSEKWRQITKESFPIPYYGFEEVEMASGHGDMCAGHYLDWLEERAPQQIQPLMERFKKFFLKIYYETDLPEELFPTSYINERTITFLERFARGDYGEKPFFLMCSYPDPHHPTCPPGRYKDMYKPDDIVIPESFSDLENVKQHKFLSGYLKNNFFRSMILRVTNEEELRTFTALTYGCISMIDNSVGQILAALEKLGLADNTIVIYTSDHGDLMGDHGLLLKGPCPFNGILNVPFIWRVPGTIKPGVTDSLASSIDISKTILNLLKIKRKNQPPDLQGVDLTPVLKDPNQKVRECCLVEHDEEVAQFNLIVRLRHLITEKYKLTVYENRRGYGDLFDRKNDPHELNNLWYSKLDLRHELMEQLFYENLSAQSRYPKRLSMS